VTSWHEDLKLAGELVTDAGRLAARMRADGIEAEQKTSVSDVVTAADHAAEALIVDRLADERPDDGVLGEEGSRREGERKWIIDPVDGTYNFVAGLDYWCSALALVEGDRLILGAVYHVASDTLYLGGPDLPTTRNGVPLAPLADRELHTSCVTTYFPPGLYGTPVGDALFGALSGAAAIRMLGSGTLDLVAIAQGQLQVFCQRDVPAWDRLPGEALIRGVGGAHHTVEAGGVSWSVIGVPTAVRELCELLRAR
jgi:myo-inositol-1(or 4)-monophosphatase